MSILSIIISTALLVGTGVVGEGPSISPAATVEMTNTLKFTPKTVTIQAGETVLWKNSSMLMHTVTCDESEATKEGSVRIPDGAEPFDSEKMQPDDQFQHTFKVKGTYRYFCKPHEGANMVGTVEVK